MFRTPLGRLRLLGLAEGVSCLVLFLVAMPMKYAAGRPELIYPVGMAHGVLLMLFVGAAAVVAYRRKWPASRLGLAFAAAVVPFGTFAFERSLRREELAPEATS